MGFDSTLPAIREKKPIIISFWHNRVAFSPFIARYLQKKAKTKYPFTTLSSKHGDGKFIGIIMNMFGFKNIAGSTKDNRKSSRGIDFRAMRDLIVTLKKGCGLGITPDGPKGPNQKINGQIIEVSKLSKAYILPLSYTSSRFIEFNSWDKFKLPLPFSKITFYTEGLMNFIDSKNDIEDDKKLLQDVMTRAQDESEKLVK